MEERRFTFSPRHLDLLAHVRASHEAVGAVCHVEVTFEGHHKFELHTLVCVMPKKLNPIQFTRGTL